jgi:hypothetical protein
MQQVTKHVQLGTLQALGHQVSKVNPARVDGHRGSFLK